MLKRAIAVLVLLVLAVAAVKLAIGLVAGLVAAVLWIVVVAALVVAGLWAGSTLRAARRGRAVPAPAEDRVALEMRRITEQLREQGRR